MDRIIKSFKIYVLLLGFLFASTYQYFSHASSPQFPPNLSEPDQSIVSNSPSVKTPEYVIIRANEESTFSSETTGKVIYLPVKAGSSFSKGAILLKLDCRLQQAELKKAIAEHRASHKALESAKKLKAYGAISEFEFVKTSADADQADAEVDKLKAIVDKCTVVAPFSGGVSEVKIHLYETAKPGDPLLKVTNTKNLAVEVQVPSKWLSWLHVGSSFKVFVNDINKMLPVKISYINPAIEPISQTVKITGQILAPENSLKPGMTGQAFFDHSEGIRNN